MFSYEFCEIFKKTFFTEHLRPTAWKKLLRNISQNLHELQSINSLNSLDTVLEEKFGDSLLLHR